MKPHPSAADESPHASAVIDEWVFVAWSPSGEYGMISGHRLIGSLGWYWSAYVHQGYPLLHLAEFEVKTRPDWNVVKAPEMWAEHVCDDPLRQWSIGNEAYFAELDDADAALGRAYGVPRPTAFDLEWYAIGGAVELARGDASDPTADGTVESSATAIDNGPTDEPIGFEQAGVVHGLVEVQGRPNLEVAEIPAYRWRRWATTDRLAPVELPAVIAHTGLRAPFAFPDQATTDWVVTVDGWRSRPG